MTIRSLLALVLACCLAVPGLVRAEDDTVRFDAADGLALNGTWTTPDLPDTADEEDGEKADGDGDEDADGERPAPRWPAVVLVQGSGPTDRNGNRPPETTTNVMRQLAEALAKTGTASLRFDKRGMHANAGHRPETAAAYAGFFTWDGLVGDVAAAVSYVARRSDVDPDRVAVIGHSQGGTLALAALPRLDGRVRAVALLASPARPFGEIIRNRIETALDERAVPDDRQAALIERDTAIRAEIIRSGTVSEPLPMELRALYPTYAGAFLKSWLPFDPLRALDDAGLPTLVVIGRSDPDVLAEKDGVLFARMLEDRTDGSRVLIADEVSHALKPAALGAPGLEGPVDEAVLIAVTAWLKEVLGEA